MAAASGSVVLSRSTDLPTTSVLGSGFGFGSGLTGLSTAGATANTSTGLGSPKGSAIVYDLVSTNLTAPCSTGSSSGQNGSGSAPITPTKPTGKGTKHTVVHRRTITRTTTRHETCVAPCRGKVLSTG